jgi:hypothetical protein
MAVAWYHRLQVDDPYITYRYARNLAEGNGWFYNSGQQILGTTSPLYTLLLAAGASLTNNLPFLSSVFSGIALGILALLVYALLARSGNDLAGGSAALLIILNPLMADVLGFELNVYLALGFGGLLAYQSGNAKWAALLLGLATLARGDAFILAALVLSHHLWKSERGSWLPLFIYGGIIAAWAGYAIGVFGSPLPNTLAAKRALYESGYWRPYWKGAARVAWMYVKRSPLFLWFAVCALFGLARMLEARRHAALWMALAWPLLVAAAYIAMGVPEAANYYAAFAPALCILAGLGIEQLVSVIQKEWPAASGRQAWVRAALLFPLAAASLTPALESAVSGPDPRYTAYRHAGEWLSVGTDPDADVAMLEIGIVGYYSRRTIVDMCGLVTPDVADHVAAGDLTWSVRSTLPDFVLLHQPPWTPETPLAEAGWFRSTYTPVKQFPASEPYGMTLFKRN